MDSLRRCIGIVPQDCVLFHDTIMHNVAYGKLSAPHEEVMDAVRLADLEESILAMPDKFQTQVGERGLKLSGKLALSVISLSFLSLFSLSLSLSLSFGVCVWLLFPSPVLASAV